MPERPKRRKNNKNKRNKNKNNRPDANKNNSDETKLDNSESCNTQNGNEEECAESEVTETKEIKVEIFQPSIDNQNTASSSSSDVVNLNGDLNNNSNQIVVDTLTIPVEKCQDTVVHTVDTVAYVVEAPEQSHQSKAKLKSKVKSKSLDDDDATKITEITEDDTAEAGNENALALIDSQNVVVTHVESDVEWESAADLNEIDVTKPQEVATGTLSVTTIPLNVAQCDQTKSLTPDEEKSLRTYLNTLNLATQPEGLNSTEMKTEIEEIINQEIKQRLRKKASADDFFLHRHGPPRMLDVIDEEGSGSGSSMTSRRQSYLSDKRSDVEDLDDDVFEDKNKSLTKQKKMMSIAVHKKSYGQLVPQECVLVGAKLKEPEVSEARGDWTMKTVEKMTGAEVVYLTDTSSSTSSLHEIGDEDDGVDTDVSVRMITPTIEVTDTENFLKKTFISNAEDNKQDILNESQQTKHEKINDNADNINVSEKIHEELKSKNINSEHIIKVELEEDQHSRIAKSVQIMAGAERILEIQDTETKNNSHNLVRNETSNNEHIAKFTCDQGEIEKSSLPPTGKTKKNEHIINIEYEKRSEENKSDVEKVSSQNSHEIVVLSTDNIKTNLYVKDIDEPIKKDDKKTQTQQNKFDLESKVIKCEFNDAINNLIKEVASESEETNGNSKDTFSRQDSSSSVDSSQCTAKYNPNYSSLNDISNMTHDETSVNNKINSEQLSSTTSFVKDVFECVTGTTAQNKSDDDTKGPLKLRDLCVRNIATLPYGKKILEELASVSERLQHIAIYGTSSKIVDNKQENVENMPHYRLPDVSSIETISIPTKAKDPIPPPIKPRRSSLNRKSSQEDEHWTGIPTKSEPVYVCLSPSQKMLMEKTHTVITKDDASHLVDMHRKYVDRRGYNEQYKNEKEREENEVDTTPIIPFKSQTGSRLLALIRDPTLTNTINSLNQRLNISSDEIQKKRTTTMFAKSNHDRFPSRDFSFKPIPPPRPKKYSSSFYESDESSDFTDSSMRSMKSERKFFHYSTGNLNKEIESDISSIQNMHRYFTDTRDEISDYKSPRRPSLPKDLCEQQMEYIRQKEKEVEAEIQRLEALKHNIPQMQRQGPRAPLVSEREVMNEKIRDSNNYCLSRKKDVVMSSQGSETRKAKLSAFSSSQEELLRDKMYSEYVSQMAEREERKQHKVIKITNAPASTNHITISKSMPTLDVLDGKVNNRIEKEFISKARERWDKLGIKDPETEDERDSANNVYKEPKVIEHKIKVIEGGEEKDVKKLPSHLQEFVRFTAKDSEQSRSSSAIWRPGAPPPVAGSAARSPGAPPPPPPPPVWTPGSAGASPHTPRKTFRPVHFEETPPSRRKFPNSEQNGCNSGSESEGRLRTSHSAPVTGLSTLGGSNLSSRLPKAQNPTVTLLQKAREGHLPRGSNYIQQEKDAARLPRDRPSPPRGDPVHALRKEYASEGEAERSDHERGGVRKMADAHRKVEGIGPITKDGMPVALRSEVKDPSRWYKKMYDTIHKSKYDDDYVTIRYKSSRGQPQERVLSNKSQYAYFDPRSGYLSEPEGGLSRLGASTWSDAYDSDVTTGPRRRTASVQEDRRFCDVNSQYMPSTNKYSTLASARASQEVYKNQPGRIENYVPGKSSVVDKEAKQWWDEVMDIFDGQNISSTTSLPQSSPKDKKDLTTTILSKSNMARALKESGYESDSTLVFRRREDTEAPLSPAERRAAYRDLQAGGEPPLRGFRSPAPPRQESPRRYVESDVNIHYRCPVRHDPLPLVPERELARQQAEHMKRLYREQKRNKYLQELQDMQNRRHQDNFTPSQKNILPLNRYDEAEKVIAKALYTFNGQTPRELSFRKGEILHVRRQIDNNWYEGELHGRIGLFPYNYVEIQKGDVVQAPKKPVVVEGRARAKFDFTAQTNLELPLKKGEVVVLTRRIDQNWWEGRNGTKTGIFPDSYVTILQEPSPSKPDPQPTLSDKPVASPAAHGLLNGSAKRSMGSHSYTPQQNSPALSNAPPATQPLPGYVAKPAQATLTPSERGYGPPTGAGVDLNNTEPLYVDTNAEAIPYRAMYKYRPQNPDELELNEGDTVYVLEKCDDGWYVGSSQRTGRFGTFPGNYVERI